MSVLANCELHYLRCDPKYPNKKYSSEGVWEVQVRTYSKPESKSWEELGLKVKAVIPDEGPVYFQSSVRRNCFKKDKTPNAAPKVTDGNMEQINPNTVMNGSVGNVRIFSKSYTKDNVQKFSVTLMEIQVTTWLKGTNERKNDFKKVETKVIDVKPVPATKIEGGAEAPAAPVTTGTYTEADF
jgi:hypothetical protein